MPNGTTGVLDEVNRARVDAGQDPLPGPGMTAQEVRRTMFGFGTPMPDLIPMTPEEINILAEGLAGDLDEDEDDEDVVTEEEILAAMRAREEEARLRARFQVHDPFRVGNVINPGAGVGTPAEQIARQERETQPYKISLLKDTERYEGEGEVYPFVVKLTRGGERVESYGFWSEEDAIDLFNRWREDYKESLVHKTFGRVAEGVFKVNLLGENVDRRLERPRNRIDRRAIRPEEDVIAEEGLSLDINPNEPEPVVEAQERPTRRPFLGGLQRDNRGRFVGQNVVEVPTF